MNHMRLLVMIGLLSSAWSAEDPVPSPEPMPVAITQAADGTILLHARDATVHGTSVRYEPQKHKNAIGFWTRQDDWVSWTFSVAAPGTYAVEILQGCDKGSGGAEVEVKAADQTLTFIVEDTGHCQNFVKRGIGELTFKEAGSVTLTVTPKSKPGVAVMDLRQVLLTPKPKK